MSRILHRSLHEDPHMALRGQGMWVETASGAQVIDASGGAAVACLGHGNRRVAAAIAAQLDEIAYVHTGLYTNPAAEALADMLLEGEPGGLSHAFFVSSGSEAMEAAIKLARQYFLEIGQPQRSRFIARRQLSWQHARSPVGRRQRHAPRALCAAAVTGVQPCLAVFRLSVSGIGGVG
jgi:adenosylmethionine-8-amino-7-oxononanoate aminotransferase